MLKEGESTEEENPTQGEQSAATISSVIDDIKNLKSEIKSLAAQPAADIPVNQAAVTPLNINGFGDSKQYLFGIENELFNMSTRWNKIAHAW